MTSSSDPPPSEHSKVDFDSLNYFDRGVEVAVSGMAQSCLHTTLCKTLKRESSDPDVRPHGIIDPFVGLPPIKND